MYYLQSRYYDAAIGRFISADAYAMTYETPVGANMFAYCGNNPVIFADNGGEVPYVAIAAAIGGLIGGFSAYMSGKSIIVGAGGVAVTGAAVAGEITKKIVYEAKNNQGSKDYQQARSHKQANQWAEEVGFEDAESLKRFVVGKNNASKFNMFTDRSTGEIILIGLRTAKEIATDLFRW